MSFWNKSGGRITIARPGAADAVPETRAHAGEYQLLHKYLRDRFANRLVLTFAEIEDLLGFPLPEEARRQEAWWGGTDPSAPHFGKSSAQADSWILARRTATVRLGF